MDVSTKIDAPGNPAWAVWSDAALREPFVDRFEDQVRALLN